MTNSSPPPGPEQKVVEKVTNALIRWVPLGSSFGVLMHSAIQGSFGQALIMFPVTAVTGIWAAYTENFVARCREIASERGREDPDRIIRLFQQAHSAVQ